MTYILSRQLLGGKYLKWIEILQEFDLEFKKSKSKKALVFTELLCDLPSLSNNATSEEAIVDENLIMISSSDLCKTRRPPAQLQPVVAVGPFAKCGIGFTTCNPTSTGGHGYIIVAVDYFTKSAEVMPTLNNSGETAALFFFSHVVSRFGVPQARVTDHGSHFRNHMMVELATKLGLSHDSSTLYYPQANG
eukprot:PITA_02937